jgi:hypothetical protein
MKLFQQRQSQNREAGPLLDVSKNVFHVPIMAGVHDKP